MSGVFREEAIAHQEELRRAQNLGRLLRLTPAWLDVAYRAVILMMVSGCAFLAVARVGDFASGPAVVRSTAQQILTSTRSGVVAEIHVHPGQEVKRGDLLVRFESQPFLAELSGLDEAIRNQTLRSLSHVDEESARVALASLYGQRDEIQARLQSLGVRAPFDGRVLDLPVLVGQYREAGDPVARIENAQGAFRLVAAVQGEFRPLLMPGQVLEVEFDGYPNAIQELVVGRVSDAVVGPDEVRRYLGRSNADAVAVTGPRVLVEAEFSSPTFRHQHQDLALVDGLTAKASVRVQSQRLIVALIPALKALLDDG